MIFINNTRSVDVSILNPGDDIYGVYRMFPYAQARRLQVSTSDSLTRADLKMTAHKDKWNIDNASAREFYIITRFVGALRAPPRSLRLPRKICLNRSILNNWMGRGFLRMGASEVRSKVWD